MTRGQTLVLSLPASWRRPATRRSVSVTPSDRSVATTSSPCRRSATCIVSNSASCGGPSQVASSSRSPDTTRARTCARNWRTLPAHQEICDIQDDPKHVLADREDEQDQDDEAVLGEDRSPLPDQLRRQEAPEKGRAVEGRDRDQVEDGQQDVEQDEIEEHVERQGRELLEGADGVEGRDHDRRQAGHHQDGTRSSQGEDDLAVAPTSQVRR